MLLFDLPALQGCQPTQLHVQNRLRLKLAQIEALDQVLLGDIRILRLTDRLDDCVQIRQGDQISIEDMLTGTGFLQLKVRPPDNDILSVLDKELQSPFQRQRARFSVYQGEQLHPKRRLQ